MISKINIIKFNTSFKNNTEYGNPKIKGTPFFIFSEFKKSDKIFFGTYNNLKFEITKNATFFPTPFIISGEIKSKNNNQTEIYYDLKPIKFEYYWLKYIPLFGVAIFNLIFYLKTSPIEIVIIINYILLCIVILSNYYLWRKKNIFLKDFKIFFEIVT